MGLPREHWGKIHSTNPLQRRHRGKHAPCQRGGRLPQREAAIDRLVGAMRRKQYDEAALERRYYMTLETLANLGENRNVGWPAFAS